MYSLYKFVDGKEELLARYNDVKTEYEAIRKYFDSINKTCTTFVFLGESRGMVYRVSFHLTVDGITDEYMVIHNTHFTEE